MTRGDSKRPSDPKHATSAHGASFSKPLTVCDSRRQGPDFESDEIVKEVEHATQYCITIVASASEDFSAKDDVFLI